MATVRPHGPIPVQPSFHPLPRLTGSGLSEKPSSGKAMNTGNALKQPMQTLLRLFYINNKCGEAMNKNIFGCLIICLFFTIIRSEIILDLSVDTWPELEIKSCRLHPDAGITGNQCFDLGKNGSISIPHISLPQGPFTIESRFFLRDYNQGIPNISDLFAAFDVDYGGSSNSEGVDFRIGGGYNYPLVIQDGYNNVTDWNPPSYEQKSMRASISKSIGQFGLGSGTNLDGHGAWKETFTDRCVERNKWVHMAATWDGTVAQIYLNGHNATDTWRAVGADLPVFIRDTSSITIGEEHVGDHIRHFDGEVEFIKFYNEAFSSCEIWRKYKQTLREQQCKLFIKIESPHCGEAISRNTKVKFCIMDSLGNTITPEANTVFRIYISTSDSFDEYVLVLVTTATEFTMGELAGDEIFNIDDIFYIRIVATTDAGQKKSALLSGESFAESGVLANMFKPEEITLNRQEVIKNMNFAMNIRKNCPAYNLRGVKIGSGSVKRSSGIYISQIQNTGKNRISLFVKQ
jgi:hypothetical protein